MASCTTPTRRTSAGWTACGVCTSGSTAPHSAATKPASGGAATTSTTATDARAGHGRWWRAARAGGARWPGARPRGKPRPGAAGAASRDYDLSARSGADAQGCGGPGTGGALQKPDELGRDACGKTRRELEAYLICHRAVGADLVHGVAVEVVVLDHMVVAGRVLARVCDH